MPCQHPATRCFEVQVLSKDHPGIVAKFVSRQVQQIYILTDRLNLLELVDYCQSSRHQAPCLARFSSRRSCFAYGAGLPI
jgi:hypothetical protein